MLEQVRLILQEPDENDISSALLSSVHNTCPSNFDLVSFVNYKICLNVPSGQVSKTIAFIRQWFYSNVSLCAKKPILDIVISIPLPLFYESLNVLLCLGLCVLYCRRKL